MSDYYNTVSKCGQYNAGDVIRLFDGAFPDAVILGFDNDGAFRCARPYVYASLTGTTCANPLLGYEKIDYPASTLTRVEKVGHGRTT